jgi:hypothetical protein
VRKRNTTELWIYPTLAAYNADTVPNGTGAATLDDVSGDTFYVDNYTRMLALDAWIKAALDGPEGRMLYEYYFQQIFDQKIALFTHFADVGGHWIGASWDLKNSQYDADTPRAAWMRGPLAALRFTQDDGGILAKAAMIAALLKARGSRRSFLKSLPALFVRKP